MTTHLNDAIRMALKSAVAMVLQTTLKSQNWTLLAVMESLTFGGTGVTSIDPKSENTGLHSYPLLPPRCYNSPKKGLLSALLDLAPHALH